MAKEGFELQYPEPRSVTLTLTPHWAFSFQKAIEIHFGLDAPLWRPLCGVHGHALHSCLQCALANTDALRDALQFFTGESWC